MFRPSSFPQIPHWTLIIASDLFKPVQIPQSQPGFPFSFAVCGIMTGLLHFRVAASPWQGSTDSSGDPEQSDLTHCLVTSTGANPAQLPRIGLGVISPERGIREWMLQSPAGAVPAPGAAPAIPGAHSELRTIQALWRVILGSFQTSSHWS